MSNERTNARRVPRERNNALVRVLTMAELLRRGRYDLDQLAREFSVTTRTVRRDLDALSVAGVAVQHSRSDPSRDARALWWVDQQRWTDGQRRSAEARYAS